MAEYASFIYVFREEYLKRLEVHAKRIMKEISDGREEIEILHVSDIPFGLSDRKEVFEEYMKVFSSSLDRESAAGVTLFGPHREDIEIKINGKSARSIASQGQQRSIVLSLKLAEGEACLELSGEYPVFLFDDVLSELDEKRRAYLLSKREDRQIIITSCEKKEIADFSESLIRVSDGSFTEQIKEI